MRIIGFAVFAFAGLAMLLGLGIWQVQRLAWKTDILDRIDARIVAAPVSVPAEPTEAADEYLPVRVSGRPVGDPLHILVTTPDFGPSYRVVTAFETEGDRRILIDLGAIPTSAKNMEYLDGSVAVTGNLLWPDEVDGFTPDPDLDANIWFARDLPGMSEALATEPVLVVAREPVIPAIRPLPIDSSTVPNDHLQYAITWFSLAAIWAGMTVLLLWRMAYPRAIQD